MLLVLLVCALAWGQLPSVVPPGDSASPSASGVVPPSGAAPQNPFRTGGSDPAPQNPFRTGGGSDAAPQNPFRTGGSDAAPQNPFRTGGSDAAPQNPFRTGGSDAAPRNPFRTGGSDAAPQNPFRSGGSIDEELVDGNPFLGSDEDENDEEDKVKNPFRKSGRREKKSHNPFRSNKKGKKGKKGSNPFRRSSDGGNLDKENPYSRVYELNPDDVERKEKLRNPHANATEVKCFKQYFRYIKVELRIRRRDQRRLARYLRRAQRCGNNLSCRGKWEGRHARAKTAQEKARQVRRERRNRLFCASSARAAIGMARNKSNNKCFLK